MTLHSSVGYYLTLLMHVFTIIIMTNSYQSVTRDFLERIYLGSPIINIRSLDAVHH